MRCRRGFDAEVPAVIAAVFERLAIGDFTIQLNHRKTARLLRGAGHRGRGAVRGPARTGQARQARRGGGARTLAGDGLAWPDAVVDQLMAFSKVRSRARRCAGEARCAGRGTRLFEEGRAELRAILQQLRRAGRRRGPLRPNLSIARGWTTTPAWSTTTLDAYPQIGSICSGGRYENLASHYTKSKLPGVGIRSA